MDLLLHMRADSLSTMQSTKLTGQLLIFENSEEIAEPMKEK